MDKKNRNNHPDNYLVRMYLQEIAQYPLLTKEREKEIIGRMKKGYSEAREELIKSNLWSVVKIAKRYQSPNVHLIDLISQGNIGLIKAVGRHDPGKGARLASYAHTFILGAIVSYLTENKYPIRRPRDKSEVYLEFIYLDNPKKDDNEKNRFYEDLPSSLPTPYDIIEKRDRSNLVRKSLSVLNEKQRKVIEMRFGLIGNKKTLEEIAKMFKVGMQAIAKIEIRALRNLKKHLGESHLKEA